jgi:hypothetical protein
MVSTNLKIYGKSHKLKFLMALVLANHPGCCILIESNVIKDLHGKCFWRA